MLDDGWRYFMEDENTNGMLHKAGILGVPTRAEERSLLQKAQGGCEHSREMLIVRNSPFVVTVAKRHRGLGMEVADLFQCGLTGLNKAIDRYDVGSKNCRLITYAVWWIRQAMLVELQSNSATIRVPINRQTKLKKVRRLVRDARDNGKNLPDESVAEAVGVRLGVAQDLIRMVEAPVSLQSYRHGNKDGSDPEDELSDALASPEAADDVADESEYMWMVGLIYGPALTLRERHVMLQRFMEERTLEDVSGDIGVTRERVRQIELQAIMKLRHICRKSDKAHGITPSDRRSMIQLGV